MSAAQNHYHVTLDIDKVLCCTKAKNQENTVFFKKEGKILFVNSSKNDLKTHYIFPGVIELLALICQLPAVRLSFFSAGEEMRNKSLVKQLLTEALGPEGYESVKDKIQIFSRHHLSLSWKKDLTLVDQACLNQVILADDTMMNVPPEQNDQLLYIPPSSTDRFDRVDSKCDTFQKCGEKQIQIGFVSEKYRFMWIKKASQGSLIAVIETGSGYQIGFVDKESHQYSEHPIPEEGNEELLKELKKYSEELTYSSEYPEWIVQNIRSLVHARGGRTNKIWRAANRVYYIAGCLVKILEQAQAENVSFSASLTKLYSQVSEIQAPLDRKMIALSKHDALYHLGLETLRRINPELRFTTPHTLRDCISNFSRDDMDDIQQAIAFE